MPLIETKGAASAQGFGEFAQASTVANYIEDVFSTYLYTGNGSTQTITNNIGLSTKGGLVWIKDRSQGNGYHHILQDTDRGASWCLFTNLTNAQSQDSAGTNFAFNSNGFYIGSSNVKINGSDNYTSWTFRKQPKFFDVVTYTGNGTAGRTVSHNLGSAPGFMVIKRTDSADEWFCYHRSLGASKGILLNQTLASFNAPNYFNSTDPTSTVFTLGTDSGLNGNGFSYVAYLFAHDAGGFGLTGTDNVISCGSYTGNGTQARAIDLGYEPQWILWKSSNYPSGLSETNWQIYDNMRGWLGNAAGSGADSKYLVPNTPSSEAGENKISITPTGFTVGGASGGITNVSGDTYIYIAIRRGPMKVPTSGTSVFSPVAYTGNGGSPKAINAGFVGDAAWGRGRTDTFNWNQVDRLRGSPRLSSNATSAEATSVYGNPTWDTMTGLNGVNGGTDNSNYNQSSMGYIFDVFRRAPSFFDVVCYTGTGTQQNLAHNLTVAPELLIVKRRSGTGTDWAVYSAAITASYELQLNTSDAKQTGSQMYWANTAPTASVFTVRGAGGGVNDVNASGSTYIAYLFATCAGVSKVGSYTGTGATQTISCGFTGGARFVLIKRTDTTGDWYVWDTARGMVSGTDPSLLLNSTAVEVNANSIYTTTGGFQIVSTAAGINASGGTYIYLAIA